jgi:hypothetical protein
MEYMKRKADNGIEWILAYRCSSSVIEEKENEYAM